MSPHHSIAELIRHWKRCKPLPKPTSSPLAYVIRSTRITTTFQCFLIQHRTTHSIPFTVTRYLTEKAVTRSPATLRNDAYGIAYLYSFADAHGINLNSDIAAGKGFDLGRLAALRDFIRAKANPTSVVLPSARMNKKLNSIRETNRIMDLISRYLSFGYLCYSATPETGLQLLEKHRVAVRYGVRRNEPLRVLPAVIMAILDEAFALDSAKVWKAPTDRLRNYCIYQLARETGARIAEIMGLEVGDISTGSESFV